MFNGQYVHIDYIMEKLHTNYGFENLYEDEVKEWIWDFLGHLGRPEFLQDKTLDIKVSSHRGIMPDDIYEGGNVGIRDKETGIPLIPSSDIYMEQNTSKDNTLEGIVQGVSYTADEPEIGDRVELEPSEYAVEFTSVGEGRSSKKFTYRIDGPYIFCGLENTTLELSYRAFPVWDDNTPKIPNDSKVIRAAIVFVAWTLAQRLLFKQGISERLYERLEQEYSFVVGAARNRLIQPDMNEMEAIRRTHMRLIPKPNRFDQGFRNLTDEERLGGR